MQMAMQPIPTEEAIRQLIAWRAAQSQLKCSYERDSISLSMKGTLAATSTALPFGVVRIRSSDDECEFSFHLQQAKSWSGKSEKDSDFVKALLHFSFDNSESISLYELRA
jgi:hypothetical protein